MKKLEKKVHFTAEGTSIGCYDSKGSPMRYILRACDRIAKEIK